MSWLEPKPTPSAEPTTTEPTKAPAKPAEVFVVPAECWKCANRYQCEDCEHGLKETMVVAPEPFYRPFYFGCKRDGEESSEPHNHLQTVAACQGCRDLTAENQFCRRYWKQAADVLHCRGGKKAAGPEP